MDVGTAGMAVGVAMAERLGADCLDADCVWDGRMREQLSALIQKQVLHTTEIYTHETEMACKYKPT